MTPRGHAWEKRHGEIVSVVSGGNGQDYGAAKCRGGIAVLVHSSRSSSRRASRPSICQTRPGHPIRPIHPIHPPLSDSRPPTQHHTIRAHPLQVPAAHAGSENALVSPYEAPFAGTRAAPLVHLREPCQAFEPLSVPRGEEPPRQTRQAQPAGSRGVFFGSSLTSSSGFGETVAFEEAYL